jgi:probable HAF family extracellular repeat protein
MGDPCKKVLVVLVPLCSIICVAAPKATVSYSGQIAGNSVNHSAPTIYTVTDLGGLSGTQSAQANDSGQIVGKSANHAFLWENGSVKDLGTLGGEVSSANAINDRGQVVGESGTATGEIHAFLGNMAL